MQTDNPCNRQSEAFARPRKLCFWLHMWRETHDFPRLCQASLMPENLGLDVVRTRSFRKATLTLTHQDRDFGAFFPRKRREFHASAQTRDSETDAHPPLLRGADVILDAR